MSDGEYVPSSDADSDASSMDAVAASGDDEVVLAVCTSSTSDLRRRRRKRRRRTVSSAVIPVLVDMDTSAEEVPGHKQFKTFRGIWKYKISWEEVRSRKLRYRVVVTPQEPSSIPALFPSQSFFTSTSTPYLRLPLFHLLFLRMSLLLILCRPLLLSIPSEATFQVGVCFSSFCLSVLSLLGFLGSLTGVSGSLGCFCFCSVVWFPSAWCPLLVYCTGCPVFFSGFLAFGDLNWSTAQVTFVMWFPCGW